MDFEKGLFYGPVCVIMSLSIKKEGRFYDLCLFRPDGGSASWLGPVGEALGQRKYSPGRRAAFLPGLVELRTVHNYGAAWSSFSGMRWMLVTVTSGIVVVVVVLLVKKIIRHPLGVIACGLIIGGGLGNIIDRVRLGYVVDMFCFEFMNFPVFNVADMCIDAGCVLGIIYYIWFYEKFDKGGGLHGNPSALDG